MPRGDQLPSSMQLLKALILGVEKSGKTDWAARAAEAGFKVIYLDGDVGRETIFSVDGVKPEFRSNIYYIDCRDVLDGGTIDTRMVNILTEFFTNSKLVWNDTKQKIHKRSDPVEDQEIWEIRPSLMDSSWVLVLDSWTTLSWSGMLAKAIDLGVDIADVEKVSREIYAGVGNRLTNFAHVIRSLPCHAVVIGHPAEFQKKRSPEGVTVRNAKELDMIIEWTRMVPKSSSNPHSLTLGKNFNNIGWIDIQTGGKRIISFIADPSRSSGGSIGGKGDTRGDYTFGECIKKIGGTLPAPGSSDSAEPVIKIFPAGTWEPPSLPGAKPLVLGAKAAAPTTIQMPQPKTGLGALLNKGGAGEAAK